MTDTEANIAIAEWAGWTRSEQGWWSHPTLPDNGGAEPEPPDYCHDLNAMHEAESKTDWKEGNRYESFLNRVIIEYYQRDERNGLWPLWHSTARQRAEALLRTIGKWEE